MDRTIFYLTARTAFPADKKTTVTLPVGNNRGGFTLIELVLVMLLMGVSLLIVLPNINKGMQDREVRKSALGLAAAARDLRSRALRDGVAQQLALNVPQSSYLAGSRREAVHLPGEIRFEAMSCIRTRWSKTSAPIMKLASQKVF